MLRIFLLLPLLEISLFVWIGGVIGVWLTLAWVLLAVAVGVAMLRHLGTGMQRAVHEAMSANAGSGLVMAERGMLLVSALLFIVPGFLSDFAALLLLPQFIRRLLLARFAVLPRSGGPARSPGTVILDAEYEVVNAPPSVADPAVRRLR
jgi:UPF0716 protein FxsA